MEGIRIIGTSLCITLVITSIFSMLMPNTKLDKVVGFALSLFFLTSVIAPFANSKLDFNIDIDRASANASQYSVVQGYDDSLTRLTERNVENSLQRILMQAGVDSKKIQVAINKTVDGGICISKVVVVTGEDTDIISLNQIVKREVGITPTVVSARNEKTGSEQK